MTDFSGDASGEPGTSGDPLGALVDCVDSAFRQRYRQAPAWIVAAPGRVNLIGEHIDYNDGFVLPMAIERYVVIAATPQSAKAPPAARFYSVNLDREVHLALGRPPVPGRRDWSSYVQGVVAGFLERGGRIPALSAVIQSNVPLGGGLSSSAALEVATATLLATATGTALDRAETALLCQRAEHRFAGVPCGIMDQFSSVFGRQDTLLLLDCRSHEVQLVPFVADDIAVLIANSNVRRELTGGEYAERRAQCESARQKLALESWRDAGLPQLEAARGGLDDVEYRRARHVVSEIGRTCQAAAAAREGQWDEFGRLMYASHASLRDDFQVSCRELDLLVDLARDLGKRRGIIGSRMTGAGFGGCTVSLVKSDRIAAVSRLLGARYREATGIEPHIFSTRPARGAHVIRG